MPFKHYEDHLAYQRKYKQRARQNRKEKLDCIKNELGCYCCGKFDAPCSMDFHHINENEKEYILSGRVMQGLTEERLSKELDKCIVICKSCHHKYHNELLSILDTNFPKLSNFY